MHYDREYHKILIERKPSGWLNTINSWDPEPPRQRWYNKPSEVERRKYVAEQEREKRAKEEARDRRREEKMGDDKIHDLKISLFG